MSAAQRESLESILSEQAVETHAEQEEVAEETQEDTAVEETGEEEAQVAAETQETQQQQVEDPVADLKAKVTAELEAAKAEKAALAKERERIRQKEQALEAQRQQPTPEDKKGFWDDPEGAIATVEQRVEQRMLQERLNISEMYARERHADYQEKLDAFADMVRENPALYHQMMQQANPAEFAYKTASSTLKLKEMGDPQEYERKLRENIEAELRAKIAAEAEAQKAAQVEEAIKQKLPKSGFSEKRSVGGVKNPPYSGPRPLGDILRGG